MSRIKLRFVHAYRDRHGKLRHYFRRPGFKQVPLPGLPGSGEFMDAYQAALDGETALRARPGETKMVPGTVSAAVTSYVSSAAFQWLAPETRRTRRNILERFRAEHGDKRVALLQRAHIERMLAAKAGTPSAARNFFNTLRTLMRHCMALGTRDTDPTEGIKRPTIRTDGFRTWTEEDIAAFEARHAIGTRARLALALLLHTAQRRGDVVRMGRQHIRNGAIQVRQQKTGKTLMIPLHPELAAILDATPREHLTFLVTAAGKPFSPAGFTNWFREVCNDAGRPRGTSAHGLRKAACRRLAEAGCSANQIAAVSGHSLREVERYTAAANQEQMARAAISRTSSG